MFLSFPPPPSSQYHPAFCRGIHPSSSPFWCWWSNRPRAHEPIHFHLVIYRRFDLPLCSSISIRGGLQQEACQCVCMLYACVSLSLWVCFGELKPCCVRLTIGTPPPSPSPTCQSWRYCDIEDLKNTATTVTMNGRLQKPISHVTFVVIDEIDLIDF